jgi:hypothetical protein
LFAPLRELGTLHVEDKVVDEGSKEDGEFRSPPRLAGFPLALSCPIPGGNIISIHLLIR